METEARLDCEVDLSWGQADHPRPNSTPPLPGWVAAGKLRCFISLSFRFVLFNMEQVIVRVVRLEPRTTAAQTFFFYPRAVASRSVGHSPLRKPLRGSAQLLP